MKIIGLCGTSGAGKGTVGKFLCSFGCSVIDTDKLYHDMIQNDCECSREIVSVFGDGVKLPNGGIDRTALAKIVFSDKEKLSSLNSVAHKYVRDACVCIIENMRASGDGILVIDAPQLFEAGMQDMCDATVAVTADRETRQARICARDSISCDRANARMDAQHTDIFFVENCDYVIENNSDIAHLLLETKKVLDKIKGMN